ncbi:MULTISPECIES: GNAT family N-acetyltransferase [unclassified Fibrobacter]|uniref:GNAT family N-acetyltransferase n=1 Tax=unclassified Fibrobacter TaxID=2634177 RepID=UPI000914EB7B|nr:MULTISPECIES: N-acetyltransferase [unclassified Fibrobacter]OWV04104.1 GNAT family N-acetyltransferase [Fibrobacter sp. UWH3]SHL50622.1 Predicted N-acetyltransferase YhbS [Fibrobacter sp. UWH5]SHL56729.1 Predicted N-acetyltransferase YhbS [Fibrobacter sp. UWH6]
MSINSEYTIRQEQPADFSAVENLTREAFWNVYRPGCSEHYVLHCYRNHPDFIPELSLVLEGPGNCGLSAGENCREAVGREILAHVMFAWSEILVDPQAGSAQAGETAQEPQRLRMMTFGPISVRPDMQRKGLGKMLLDYALERARQMGAGCIAMCGNIQFYGKCGFAVATSKGIRYADDPDGDAPYFLIRELTPGFLDGIRGSYRDPSPYFVDDKDVEEFDKQFPPKEKKVLPGQLG